MWRVWPWFYVEGVALILCGGCGPGSMWRVWPWFYVEGVSFFILYVLMGWINCGTNVFAVVTYTCYEVILFLISQWILGRVGSNKHFIRGGGHAPWENEDGGGGSLQISTHTYYCGICGKAPAPLNVVLFRFGKKKQHTFQWHQFVSTLPPPRACFTAQTI